MRYRRRRKLLFKQKHFKAIIIGLAAIIVVVAAVAVITATGRQAKRNEALLAVLSKNMINIGMRGDLGALSTYDEQTGRYEGFEKDIADELTARLFDDQIIINYIEVNSRTKDAMLRRGDIDIALAATVERSTSGICYTSSYYTDACAFMVVEGSMTDMRGLVQGVVALVDGTPQVRETDEEITVIEEYFQSLRMDTQIKIYASYPEAISALQSGFVDGICASEIMLRLFGVHGMVILPERFLPNNYCVGVSENLGTFCEVVDDVIDQMRRDGTIDTLISKWNLTNYTELGIQ